MSSVAIDMFSVITGSQGWTTAHGSSGNSLSNKTYWSEQTADGQTQYLDFSFTTSNSMAIIYEIKGY